MVERRKYKVGVPDELHTRRADSIIEADNVVVVDGHLYLYREGRCVAAFSPGGWHQYREEPVNG